MIGCVDQTDETSSFGRDASEVGEDVEPLEHLRDQEVPMLPGLLLPTPLLEGEALLHPLCREPVHELFAGFRVLFVLLQHVEHQVVEFALRLRDFNPVLQELERFHRVSVAFHRVAGLDLGKPICGLVSCKRG